MPKIELGTVGVVVDPTDAAGFTAAVAEAEVAGFPTAWVTGGPLAGLDQIAAAVQATHRIKVAPGILAVIRFDADSVIALHHELAEHHAGRLVVGLGGAHGPQPLATLGAYLDRLDQPGGIPVGERVLAALGPKMLRLARDRAAGAFPVLVTPDYTRGARRTLGDDTTLAVEQMAVIETDPDRARAVARGVLGRLGSFPQYQASFQRMGFAGDDLDPSSDRLADALVAWGGADTVAGRVREQLDAGADHVAVNLLTAPGVSPVEGWRALAERLL